jgi:hypothetical protein
MKVTHGKALIEGKRVEATRISEGSLSVVCKGTLSVDQAKNIVESFKKYREFNRKDPRRLVGRKIDFTSPLIRLGPVPVITYVSDKEGKKRNYAHETDEKNMPTLYWQPQQNFGLIIGGKTRIKNGWLDR